MNSSLSRLKEIDREIQLLEHTTALLGWDQETYMPEKAIEERAQQQSLLSGIIHDKLTGKETSTLLSSLGIKDSASAAESPFGETDRAFLRKFSRDFYRETKIPKELVVEFSREASLSQAAWIEARKKSDFSIFAPHLEKILELTKEKAEKIGYAEHPYDALLDEYEPFATTSYVKSIFETLKPKLRNLVKEISRAGQVDDSFLKNKYSVDFQEKFGREILVDLGYEFDRGRLDVSAHPFTTTLGFNDIRLTTRYREDSFKTGLFGIIHECGHGLYELGIDEKIAGTVLAQGTSLGIHESQSRTWENMIGLSLPFWKYYYPKLRKMFPTQLDGVTLEQFYRGINRSEPSLIRIDADEVTYSLHIILRFELELQMISGELKVRDLPEAWNSGMKELLGITPADDAEGVLQDVHWSFGAIGYFPTYALGNLYGAQFFQKLDRDLGGVVEIMERGDFKKILGWLRDNIHRYGSIYTAEELCMNATGEALNPDYFIDYLEKKYSGIYGLK